VQGRRERGAAPGQLQGQLQGLLHPLPRAGQRAPPGGGSPYPGLDRSKGGRDIALRRLRLGCYLWSAGAVRRGLGCRA
jgi:hypothetical protein